MSAIIAMVGLSTVALPAYGADFTVQNGQTVGGQTLPLAGDTGTIEAGGTVNGVGASDGIEATGGVDGVTVNNAGTVTSASQDGIDVNDGNTIVNSGTVQGGSGGGDRGIEAGSNNTITNSGSIASPADDGIFAISGNTIDNSGTITGGSGGVDAGIQANANNIITNSGTITGVAGRGIDVNNGNTVTNTGTISSTNQDGVEAGSNNTITNDGTISSGARDAIDVNDNNTITNTGTIAGGNGGGHRGIEARDGNVITNSGTVTSGGDDGINVGNNNTVVNSGTVQGGATNDHGIRVNSNNTVTNTGTVISQDNDAVSGNNGNTITNSGVIRGGATGNVQGIDLNADGTIINSGQIFGSEAIEINGGTIVNSGTIQGNLAIDKRTGADLMVTNSGSIIGTGGDAISFRGGDDTLSLLPGSNIQGTINFRGGDDTLIIAPGLSIANTFVGTLPENINANGAPVAINGLQVAVVDPTGFSLQDDVIVDLTNGVSYAVFGALSAARTGSGGASTRQAQPQYLSYSQSSPKAHADTGWRYWSRTYGARRKQEGSGASVDSRHGIIGSVYGVDTSLWNNNARGGGFVGASISVAETVITSQETQIDSFYGGLYVGTTYGKFAFDFAVYGGHTSHERRRLVANNLAAGGLQIGQADFDGTFVAPEASLTANMPGGFVASGRARYISFRIDGFSETGAAGNFTAGDRNLEIFHGRFQLGRPFVTSGEGSSYTRIEPYIGVEGRSLLSGENINATLLGQSLTFAPGGEESVTSFFIGTDLSARITGNLDFYANAEANFEELDSDYRVNASFGFKYKF